MKIILLEKFCVIFLIPEMMWDAFVMPEIYTTFDVVSDAYPSYVIQTELLFSQKKKVMITRLDEWHCLVPGVALKVLSVFAINY